MEEVLEGALELDESGVWAGVVGAGGIEDEEDGGATTSGVSVVLALFGVLLEAPPSSSTAGSLSGAEDDKGVGILRRSLSREEGDDDEDVEGAAVPVWLTGIGVQWLQDHEAEAFTSSRVTLAHR